MRTHEEPSWDDEPTLGRRPADAGAVLEGVPPRPALLVESGSALGRYFALPDAPCEVRVGRGRDADCRVRDRSVSRAHILLRIGADGRVEIRDLDSLNGTWINGRRLRGTDQVFDGDRIRVGDLDLRIAWMTARDLAYQDRIARQVRLAERDALTGLHNRNFLLDRLPDIIEQHRQLESPLALVTIDVDRFKAVNDTWGHAAGDVVLALLARCLAEGVRPEDHPIRAGGEEFWIVMPHTSLNRAVRAAERLRRAVSAVDYGEALPTSWALTISAGVAEIGPDEPIDGWMRRADLALYEAKNSGRNRVVHSGGSASSGALSTDPFETDRGDLAAQTPLSAATQRVEVLDISFDDELPSTELC